LRSIVENIMMEIMYEIPSIENVQRVVVTRDCVLNGTSPEVIRGA
jgi:ATP-dependent Clp protease ATP-binding subunit ClpX